MQEDVSVLLVGDVPVEEGGFDGGPEQAMTATRVEGQAGPSHVADVALVGADGPSEVDGRFQGPVVVATDDPAGALADGADDWVPTDAPVAVVAHRVRAAAERHRRRRQQAELLDDPLTARTVVDHDGHVRAVNEAALAFTDQQREAVLGEVVWELPWAERSPEAGAAYRRAIERAAEGETAREHVEARDAQGVVRTIDVLARPLDDGRIVVEGRDVGMLLDDDAAIEPPSRRLRTIVDNLPIVLFAFDVEGTFTLSEGRGLAKLGLEPGEVVGESVFDVYGDRAAVVEATERALAGEETTVTVEAGGHVWDSWFQPVVDDGTVRSVLGAAIDVTARVRHERELEQYETIVDTVPDGVFVLDENGRMLEGNETAARMLGYDHAELEGEPFEWLVEEGVVDPDLVEEYLAVVRELLSSDTDRERGRIEFEIHPPDGGRRIVEVHVALRPYDEAYRGTIGVVRDVTDRREREHQLRRQNERLEEFASVVGHDLRNPLSVARGTADLLADDVDAGELDQIRRSLRRMDDLVEDLLELARTGQTVTEPTAVDLADVAADAWSTVDATDAGLAVQTDAVIRADRSRLRQLLENLFGNAVEHGSTSPRSQAREDAVEHAGDAPRIEVGDLDDGRGFYVADDGPGIPPAERDRVLEHGYTTADDGTGFGLAIVRSVAEAHGWTVAVAESEAGGARFEFADVEPAG